MYNQRLVDPTNPKVNALSTKSPRETVCSTVSEQQHASSVEGVTEVPDWHLRTYTEEDFDRLKEALKNDDVDIRPTAKQLELLKARLLNKPLGCIKRYIALGRAPPPNWVESSLYYTAFEWLDICP